MPGLGSVSSGLLHQEISRLNGLLEEKISEHEQLERELVDIRRHGKERIQTLEQQVGASLPAFVACSQFRKDFFFGDRGLNLLFFPLASGPHLHRRF